jgi:peptidoglycan/xylan/chitin deacetylase (PgdA/CDA1 family)
VFTLHRVVEPGRPLLWPGYEIHADVLDAVLGWIARLGWEVVSLDALRERVLQGERRGRHVCLTFDDGYEDTLRLALPVLRRHGAPFTVYATTGLVERRAFYWWGALADVVTRADRVAWPGSDGTAPRTLPAATWPQKRRTYATLCDLCELAGGDVTRALLGAHGVDWEGAADRDFLTLASLAELAADPLAAIGAHGVTHRRLGALGETTAERELAQGKRTLERWLGREVRHVAYPFGSPAACGAREFALAAELGFATGVTTRRGNVFPGHRDRLTALPRREIPLSVFRLRNALTGVETLLQGTPRVQRA